MPLLLLPFSLGKGASSEEKAAAASIPGRMKSELASEEDEYVVEQLGIVLV